MRMQPLARSLWSALSPAAPGLASLDDEISSDVLIVGAGLMGLTAAVHLAERGVSVAVLEAEEPGHGASGRNTGFVVPSLRTGLGRAEVEAAVGSARAEGLISLVHSGGDQLFALIERLGIDCSAERVGWLQPAHTAAFAERLRVRVREMAEHGRPVSWLPADETERRTGIRGYHGALFDESGGTINPLAYVRGLASATAKAGARIYVRSAARAVVREGQGWAVHTGRGRVRARTVLLTTNALVGSLVPGYGRGFVPVRVHQIATEPLPRNLRDAVLASRAPLSDTRRHTFAVRLSPDGRLVTGGVVAPGPGALGRAARMFEARLRKFFPQVGRLRPDYVWDGIIAATTLGLPMLTPLAPGFYAGLGCNGRGLALSAALGPELARVIAAGTEADTVLVTTRPRDIPFRQFAAIGTSLWLPWSNFRDWLDSG